MSKKRKKKKVEVKNFSSPPSSTSTYLNVSDHYFMSILQSFFLFMFLVVHDSYETMDSKVHLKE